MLAGFPKRLGRRARKVRWDARRTDAPEDSRGRPRGNKNAMGKAISPSAWQLGWGKHQGKMAYLAGVGAEAGFALVDLRFGFAGRNVVVNKSCSTRWAAMNRTAEAAQELSCNPKLANTVNRWAGMRNRRQVVEFSDCLLARNAGLRLQRKQWAGVAGGRLQLFWGPTAAAKAGASAVDNAIFRPVAQGSVWGNLQRHAGAREHVNWSRQPRALAGMFVVSGRGTRPRSLGTGVCWGGGNRGSSTWETRDHQKPRPVKLAPATFWQAPRFSLSLATLLSGPVESGTLFWGHEEKEQNRNCDKPLLSNK